DGLIPDDWYDDNRVLINYALDQKQALSGRNESFSGQVATYLDPAAAQLGRAAQVGGSYASGNTIVASTTQQQPASAAVDAVDVAADVADPPARRSFASKIGEQGGWIAVGVVLSLVALRGVWAFRRYSRSDSSDVDT